VNNALSEPLTPIKEIPEELQIGYEKVWRAHCMYLLAGWASEFHANSQSANLIVGDDGAKAVEATCTVFGCGEEHARMLLRGTISPAVRRLVRRHPIWGAIEAIATRLQQKFHVTDDESFDILSASGIRQSRR
jgi:hypothetical protein